MQPFMIVFLILLWTVVGASYGSDYGRALAMREAFDRGFAVQCPGKRGYHWDCEGTE